jgi:hypothetical protein
MAVIYSTTVKNNRMTVVRDAIDGGSSGGTLEIGTTGMASVLAVIPLADPCGSVASGVLTFTMPQSDTNADATGTAAEARIKDSSGTVIVSGLTVGTSGANINLSSVGITAGDTVTINSAAITHG